LTDAARGGNGRFASDLQAKAFERAWREYSLKKVEAFYGFERKTPLEASRVAMRYVEHRLELGGMGEEPPDEIRETMEGYNAEDCVSAARAKGLSWRGSGKSLVASGLLRFRRLPEKSGDPSEKLKDKLDRVAAADGTAFRWNSRRPGCADRRAGRAMAFEHSF